MHTEPEHPAGRGVAPGPQPPPRWGTHRPPSSPASPPQAQNRGKRMQEGAHINRSLLALGTCINALSEKGGGRAQYVNFRDSKLTRLLKVRAGCACVRMRVCARCAHAQCVYAHTCTTRSARVCIMRAHTRTCKVPVHAYMCAYACTHMRHVHACMHTRALAHAKCQCMHVRACAHVCAMHVHVCAAHRVCTCVCMHVSGACMCVYMCVRVHAGMCVCTAPMAGCIFRTYLTGLRPPPGSLGPFQEPLKEENMVETIASHCLTTPPSL